MHKIADLQIENLLGAHIKLSLKHSDVFQIVSIDTLNVYCSDVATNVVKLHSKTHFFENAYLVESLATKYILVNEISKKRKGGCLVLDFSKTPPKWSFFIDGVYEHSSSSEFDVLLSLCKKNT